MDTNVLLPAVIAFLYTVMVLWISFKCTIQRSRAMQMSDESMEIDFALREGHTVVGVIDSKKGMCFVISNNVGEEKNYE